METPPSFEKKNENEKQGQNPRIHTSCAVHLDDNHRRNLSRDSYQHCIRTNRCQSDVAHILMYLLCVRNILRVFSPIYQAMKADIK